MNIKRLVFRAAVRGMEWAFMQQKLKGLYHSNLSMSPVEGDDSIDVVTIAFNNARVIELHNEYVRKYLASNMTHIVVDNSTNMKESVKIRRICENSGVAYVRLHKNRMGVFSPSYNHSTAVNWIYKNILKPRGAWGFGFIDHDIFPVQKIDVTAILKKQPFYGAQRKWNGLWYLSAIISFYRASFIEGKRFDFMPVTFNGTYLDSGGGNWVTIYKDMKEEELLFMENHTVNFKDGDNRHQDQIELFDNERWVHTINGSYWKKIDVVKEDMMTDLISKYEKSADSNQN